MEGGIECTLCKFTNDTKLCGAVNTLEGSDAIQRACVNIMKFNTAKCKVLHMGRGNVQQKYKMAGEWIKTSPAKKDLAVLVDEKLSTTQQCVFATQKVNSTLV